MGPQQRLHLVLGGSVSNIELFKAFVRTATSLSRGHISLKGDAALRRAWEPPSLPSLVKKASGGSWKSLCVAEASLQEHRRLGADRGGHKKAQEADALTVGRLPLDEDGRHRH